MAISQKPTTTEAQPTTEAKANLTFEDARHLRSPRMWGWTGVGA